MSSHPNVELYMKAFGAFMSGEDPTGEGLSDDIVWHTIGSDEPIRGKAALAETMGGFPEGLEFNVDVHDVVANDDHIVALVEASVTTEEGEFNYRTAEICHVENGEITERWAFSDDTQAITDFFGSLGG